MQMYTVNCFVLKVLTTNFLAKHEICYCCMFSWVG